MKEFVSKKNLSNSALLTNTALFFLDKPYVASTLDQNKNESLVVNLREFDCVTFIESCLALVLTLKAENPSFEKFCDSLQSIRYRNGIIKGYTSRLHYTSDWICENERNGFFEDISGKCGGVKMTKEVSFMTKNAHLYKQLASDSSCILEMKEIEENLNKRHCYVVLLSSYISDAQESIKSGNIIAFATEINGLDYSHIGIAYWREGELHFIHASSKEKKLIVDEKPLSLYCKQSKTCSGISILNVK